MAIYRQLDEYVAPGNLIQFGDDNRPYKVAECKPQRGTNPVTWQGKSIAPTEDEIVVFNIMES